MTKIASSCRDKNRLCKRALNHGSSRPAGDVTLNYSQIISQSLSPPKSIKQVLVPVNMLMQGVGLQRGEGLSTPCDLILPQENRLTLIPTVGPNTVAFEKTTSGEAEGR